MVSLAGLAHKGQSLLKGWK